MSKKIEQLTDADLEAVWPEIGGAPHLFEYSKDELRTGLIIGDFSESGLQMDYYTMAAIVRVLTSRGFDVPKTEQP